MSSSLSARNPQKGGNLETLIFHILCRHSLSLDTELEGAVPFTLEELYQILQKKGVKTTRETVRKTLEKLISKGVVERDKKGLFICARRQTTLDMFFNTDYKKYSRFLIYEIPLSKIEHSISFAQELFEKIVQKGINLSKVEDRINIVGDLGASAADDSSRSLKVHIVHHTHIAGISARIRIGGIAPFITEVKNGMVTVSMDDEVELLPEHIKRGGSVEFLVEGFRKRPYVEPRLVAKNITSDQDFQIMREYVGKLNDYSIIEFHHQLIQHAIDRAERKASSFDFAIAFIDGSILPGHLDPKIHPGSEELKNWPPEMATKLVEYKYKLLDQFISIYKRVAEQRDDVVLVGASKRSEDRTLQHRVKVYYDVPDQELLSNVGLENAILGPFEKHRVVELKEQLELLNLTYPADMKIDSYYIFRSTTMMPLQIDVVFPKNMEQEQRNEIVKLIAHLVEESEKHSRIAEQSGEVKAISTLRPIRLVDLEVTKISEQIAKVVEKELARKIYDIMEFLAQLPITEETALFVYMSHLQRLRRLI
ncbi:MAG: hypothetical protein RRB51_10585 [Thermoproteus sp.]|nr:hypothetical protein [Thermoproteus sp.]